MNNCIFTTHHTLSKEHALYSLRSLLQNQTTDFKWDNFIIYNTHPDEIEDDWLVEQVQKLDVDSYINDLLVFPYEDGAYKKTLTQDTINHFGILVGNELNVPGKTLLLKSDYCVSTNFNEVLKTVPSFNMIWSLPIYNAKEKVSQEEIEERLSLDSFITHDEVTYYRGGTNEPVTPGTLDDPYKEMSMLELGTDETDPRIKFVSHNIQNDYNLHVFSNDVLSLSLQICNRVYNPNSTWGGAHDLFQVAFRQAGVLKYSEIKAFGVHLYHGIISVNRNEDRTDPRKVIEGERY